MEEPKTKTTPKEDSLDPFALFYEDLELETKADEEPPVEPNPPIWQRRRVNKPKDHSLRRF